MVCWSTMDGLAITPLLLYSINMGRVIVAPSILAADFSRLGDEIHRVEAAGADWIHCDIMDGHFVDNISFGPEIVGRVRGLTSVPLDVHLMIEHADHYVPRFIKAGANSITVHVEPEAKHSVTKTLQQIRDAGCRAGLTLNPETSFDSVEPFLDKIDMLLVMTVHPGFGEQQDRHRSRRRHQRRNCTDIDRKRRKRACRGDLNFSRKRLRKSDPRIARRIAWLSSLRSG